MEKIDRAAVIELLEMETVSVSKSLNALLGRNAKITVQDADLTEEEEFSACLPHFSVVIEVARDAQGTQTGQLYVFRREDVIRLTNYIMGVSADQSGPLDDIAASVLKEVASQCLNASAAELEDFVGHRISGTVTKVVSYDNAERIAETVRLWKTVDPLMLVRFQVEIEGIMTMEAFGIASSHLMQILGIPSLTEEPDPEPEIKSQAVGKSVPVSEVAFPEMRYVPVELSKDHIEEDRKRLLDVTLDVAVRIGETECSVKEILSLKEGKVLMLDKQAGSPADVVVNGELIGKGDVLVTDEHFGVRILEILSKRD